MITASRLRPSRLPTPVLSGGEGGDADVYVIVEAPDNVTAAAVSLAITASGAVSLKTTPLLSPDEIDQATKKSVTYRPPGR